MGRMVKCAFTGKIADSSYLYKVGRQWFEILKGSQSH